MTESKYNFYTDVALKPGADIDKVYEDDIVLAFHHTKPYFETHIVIIPKKQTLDIRSVDSKTLHHLISTAQKIIQELPDQYAEEYGIRLVTNTGAFQDSPHLHFYIAGGKRIRPE